MHPAPSIIVFTVLSGAGFGLLAYLGSGLFAPTGLMAFLVYALGYGLAVIGLIASTLHLGHPERALKAFTQWRSSWLSREGILAVAALLTQAPHALSLILTGEPIAVLGWVAAALSVATVLATAMIYTQLKTVPRWHHWTTPVVFALAAAAGGALLGGMGPLAQLFLAWLALALVVHWLSGDRQFRRAGSTMGTATGLGEKGRVRLLEKPHTGRNYLLTEMVHVVGRKHAIKLRVIALVAACVLPSVMLWTMPPSLAMLALAGLLHLAGMLCARWLFFAEAEHTVGLYYGMR